MIKPTVGRIVWFEPGSETPQYDRRQPLAAIITYVWNDRSINLVFFTQEGTVHALSKVRLLQNRDAMPERGSFARWMPFQLGQAAKAAPPSKG